MDQMQMRTLDMVLLCPSCPLRGPPRPLFRPAPPMAKRSRPPSARWKGPACAGVPFYSDLPCQGFSREHPFMARKASEGSCARLVLRGGCWYVGEKRFDKYSAALKAACRTVGIKIIPKLKNPPRRINHHLRLELRHWWPAYLAWQAAQTERKQRAASTLRERYLAKVVGA